MKQHDHDRPIAPSLIHSFNCLNNTNNNNNKNHNQNHNNGHIIRSTTILPFLYTCTLLHSPEKKVPPLRKNSSVFIISLLLMYITITFLLIHIFQNVNVVSTFSIRTTATSSNSYQRHSSIDRKSSTTCNIISTSGQYYRSKLIRRTTTTTTTTTRNQMLDDPYQILTSTATVAVIVSNDVYSSNTHNIFQHVFATYLHYLDQYSLFTQAVTAAFFAGLGDVLAQSIASQQTQIQRRLVDTNTDSIDVVDDNDDHIFVEESSSTTTSIGVVTKSESYDVHRTMHYVFKGLGGGCMWSVWFSYSDPISLDLTQRLLESLLYSMHHLPMYSGEVGYAVLNGDIDVATATSQALYTQIPFLSMSGCTLQHIIHVALCILLEQFFISPLFYTVWDIPIPALLSGSPIRQIPAQIQAKLVPLLIANAKVWTPANVITYSLPSEYRVLFASMTDVIWQTILSEITSNEIILQPPPIPKPSLLTAQSLQEGDSVSAIPKIQHGSTTSIPNSNDLIPESILTSSMMTTTSASFIRPPPLTVSSGVTTTTTINTNTVATTVFQSNVATSGQD